jgi:regulator of protease activity HflC (stomatin/prohibitin superfamily)
MTQVDVSVQYRIIGAQAPQILKETGSEEQAITVHLEPKLRSALREVGKGLVKAEDFFNDTTQVKLQTELKDELAEYCKPKGIEIQAILLRDMQLPDVVKTAVNAKKQREQAAVQQQAELTRFTVQAQQEVATAEAQQKAALFDAQRVKIAADAEAYKIKTINEAASSNPVYVQLQALKTLGDMAKDPAAKFYFMDGQGKTPLPLLHLGDVK